MSALERAWTYQSEWAERGDEDSLCFLDLRARLEALETNSKPTPNSGPIRSSLLDRVAAAIADTDAPADLWHDDARAALHEVAVWLQSNGHWEAADVLEAMEAHR
jgi:hypothetical protein